MLGKFLLSLVVGVIGLAIYVYAYLGISKPVTITVGERGPFTFVYKEHHGAYHQIGPVIGAVEAWAKDNSVRCELTFGEYLDDPAAIDQDRLRSRGGCLFTGKVPAAVPEEFKVEERSARRFVVGTYDGAPSAGPFTVYPKVRAYIDANRLKQKGAVMETYLIRGQKVTTEYLFPLE